MHTVDVQCACLHVLMYSHMILTKAHGFFQKMAPKSPKIFITFSDTY